jgi:hypothetical protein
LASSPDAVPTALAGNSTVARDANAIPVRPVWLFVLSRVDYGLQQRLRGAEFHENLLRRLQECAALGRHAVVIGPEPLVSAIHAHFGANGQVSTFSMLNHRCYLEHLMACEYAFFWNLLSFSLIHRVLAARPVFFFDTGHFTHLFPSVAEAGERLFYGGWKAPQLDLEQAFDLPRLEVAAAAAVEVFRRVGAGLRECASPSEVLAIARSEQAGINLGVGDQRFSG